MALPRSNEPLRPLARVAVHGKTSGNQDFDSCSNGDRFIFNTSPSRGSATIADTVGNTYGWINKSGLSDKDCVLLNAGKLYGLKSGRELVLYSSQNTVPPAPEPVKFEDSGPAPTAWQPPIAADSVEARGFCITNAQGGAIFDSATGYFSTTNNPTNKENTMNNFISRIIDANKNAATDAAVLEAGRIANNTLVKIIVSRLPFLARLINAKYVEGPVGKLLVANGALMLAQQLRPNDERVRSLTKAMTTQAYQEAYQQVDIEGMIDQLLSLPEIKRAMAKLDRADEQKGA